jgi:hypothetical protein
MLTFDASFTFIGNAHLLPNGVRRDQPRSLGETQPLHVSEYPAFLLGNRPRSYETHVASQDVDQHGPAAAPGRAGKIKAAEADVIASCHGLFLEYTLVPQTRIHHADQKKRRKECQTEQAQ